MTEQSIRNESAVDPQALTNIFGEDTAAHRDILHKFVTQTDELVVDFQSALEQRDADRIMFHAHKFKSSARTVGANQLADLCFTLEGAGRDEDWDVIDNLAGSVQVEVVNVRQYVDDL